MRNSVWSPKPPPSRSSPLMSRARLPSCLCSWPGSPLRSGLPAQDPARSGWRRRETGDRDCAGHFERCASPYPGGANQQPGRRSRRGSHGSASSGRRWADNLHHCSSLFDPCGWRTALSFWTRGRLLSKVLTTNSCHETGSMHVFTTFKCSRNQRAACDRP